MTNDQGGISMNWKEHRIVVNSKQKCLSWHQNNIDEFYHNGRKTGLEAPHVWVYG